MLGVRSLIATFLADTRHLRKGLGGIPGTHTMILKEQPEIRSEALEDTGMELAPVALRHTMSRSCTIIIVRRIWCCQEGRKRAAFGYTPSGLGE